MEKNKIEKVSTLTFIGMACALVGSVRNVPDVAAAGWTLIFYLIVATFLFGLPIVLIAAEFSSMFQNDDGGLEHWVSMSLGNKWGFTASWLLWVQMFPAMVLMASSLPPLIGIIIKNATIGQNRLFTFIVIVSVYWIITFLNIKFDMVKICGKIGIWFGLYIPLVIMTALGIMATIKVGIMPDNLLGNMSVKEFLPDSQTSQTIQYFTPIIFIFIGQEMSAVYLKRLKNPAKSYLIGATSALIFVFLLNIVNGLMLANVVSKTNIQLNNVAQCIEIYTRILHLPSIIVNIFCVFVLIGIIVQISSWSIGPAKTVESSARRGLYPPRFKFWKANENDVSEAIMFTQAVVISGFALLFLIIPNINNVIIILANSSVLQYSIAYVIMGISIVKMRKTEPNKKRLFKIGSYKTLLAVVSVLMISIIISVIFTITSSSLKNAVLVILVTLIMFILPFVIEKKRNKDWEVEVERLLNEDKTKSL